LRIEQACTFIAAAFVEHYYNLLVAYAYPDLIEKSAKQRTKTEIVLF
jgi:hypothetical protein